MPWAGVLHMLVCCDGAFTIFALVLLTLIILCLLLEILFEFVFTCQEFNVS